MVYELDEVLKMMKVFHEVEISANIFLFQSSFAMKHKKSGALKTLRALEEYHKLPAEVRKGLESDKNNHVSKIVELERLCKEAIEKDKGK
jgi:hypothetical protein